MSLISYRDHVPRLRTVHGGKWNGAVERREPSAILHREREQIDIGELLWAENARAMETLRIGERNVVGPKSVIGCRRFLLQQSERVGDWNRLCISRLRHDPYKSVLRQRTRRPPRRPVCRPPLVGGGVMNMVRLQQCDQEIDVEQRPHALVSRFRSSQDIAEPSDANFGIKGTLATL